MTWERKGAGGGGGGGGVTDHGALTGLADDDHALYAKDPLAEVLYHPAAVTTPSTTVTTHADVDATNLAITFTVPASGAVEVELTALADAGASPLNWGLREGAALLTDSPIRVNNGAATRVTAHIRRTGLTPGAPHTWKWSHARPSGSTTVFTIYGGDHGPAIMRVRDAAPLA